MLRLRLCADRLILDQLLETGVPHGQSVLQLQWGALRRFVQYRNALRGGRPPFMGQGAKSTRTTTSLTGALRTLSTYPNLTPS